MLHSTSLDPHVHAYVRPTPGFERVVQRGLDHTLAPLTLPGRRFRVDIHVTCGGGHHRSVVLTEELAARLQAAGIGVEIPSPSAAPPLPQLLDLGHEPRRRGVVSGLHRQDVVEAELDQVRGSEAVPRNYHSVANLLPDGRVFSDGGGLCGDCATNHSDGSVFTPPYVLNADGSSKPRPAITGGVPPRAAVGTALTITTGGPVASFVLMRAAAATHYTDNDQRRVP